MTGDDKVERKVVGSQKAPPAYKEGQNYEDWRLDIDLWNTFTSYEKSRRATAFLLELSEGPVKNHVRSLGKDILTADDGLDKVIARLDSIYQEDSSHMAYRAYCRFEKFERPESMNLQAFVSEFAKLYEDLKKNKMELPDAVLAYRILNSANLSSEKVDLALATVKSFTYTEMISTISKIFSVHVNRSGLDQVTESCIKTEPEESCHFTSHGYKRNRGRDGGGPMRSRGTFRNQGDPYVRGKRPRSQINCFNCGKNGHYSRECTNQAAPNPNRRYEQGTSRNFFVQGQPAEMEVDDSLSGAYITLLTTVADSESILYQKNSELNSLVFETLSCAVIDSGCTKSVVGENWVSQYIETLDDAEKEIMMSSTSCKTPFTFGDGKSVVSNMLIKIPGRIGSKRILIEANVVECDIPLLLSKPALKKVGAILNFLEDTLEFDGEKIPLLECKSGHYCVPICNKRRSLVDSSVKVFLTVTDETFGGNNKKLMEKKALKLHRQFAHAPMYKLKTLLKNAGFDSKLFLEVLEDVCQKCEVCQRYSKPKPRPVVGLPRGTVFNDCVAMDLKTVQGEVTFLHMIDCATRYSVAKLVPNKRKETIVDAICSGWIAQFWPPRRFMADNGGEFSNAEYVEMCERFNIESQQSAAESPFSNGMVERHHQVLAESMVKTKQDSNCSWKTALCWALSAKNSLQMTGGYSPMQLVMGRNPSFPNVIDSKLPAMESSGSVGSETVENHLRAMRTAREEFVRAESSSKIMKALKSQVRTCNDVHIDAGEKIFYKRNSSDSWHGPGVVIGRDGQTFVVKHGFQIIKVHPCHIKPTFVPEEPGKLNDKGDSTKAPSESKHDESSDFGNMTETEVRNQDENEILPLAQGQITDEIDSPSSAPVTTARVNNNGNKNLPKTKTYVMYKPKYPEEGEEEVWEKAYILSRAGKAGGKYKNCLNIQLDGEEETHCVDWFELTEEWHEDTEEEQEHEVMFTSVTESCEQAIVDAKGAELEKFCTNKVYEEVPDEGQKTVGVRWVITKKIKNTGNVYKARLVALGYQEKNQSIRSDSPTCSRDSIRMAVTLLQAQHWKLQHIDVQAAFLQGKHISRTVFIKPPNEAKVSGKLWKLRWPKNVVCRTERHPSRARCSSVSVR